MKSINFVTDQVCLIIIYIYFFSFILYSAIRRVGRAKLGTKLLKHSVPFFLIELLWHCVLTGNTQSCATPEWGNKNFKYSKWELNPQPSQAYPCATTLCSLDKNNSYYSGNKWHITYFSPTYIISIINCTNIANVNRSQITHAHLILVRF